MKLTPMKTANQSVAQHTPGRWQNCLGSFGPYVVAETPGKDVRIAVLHYSATPDVSSEEENAANCRLIAAAPDLLAALEDITALAYDLAMKAPMLTPSVDRIIPQARAAIARARGVQS